MNAEDVWALFVSLDGRDDVPPDVRRSIGGAALRLFPVEYRREIARRSYRRDPARHAAANRASRGANPERWAAWQRSYITRLSPERRAEMRDQRRAADKAYRDAHRTDRALAKRRARATRRALDTLESAS